MSCSTSSSVFSKHMRTHQELVKKFNGRYISPYYLIPEQDKQYVTVSFERVEDMIQFEMALYHATSPIVEKVRKLPWHRRVLKFLSCRA